MIIGVQVKQVFQGTLGSNTSEPSPEFIESKNQIIITSKVA
jgi:hypothetical protein